MIELRHMDVRHFVIIECSYLANGCTIKCGCIDDNFQKLKEDAKEHSAKSTLYYSKTINKLKRWMPTGSTCLPCDNYRKLSNRRRLKRPLFERNFQVLIYIYVHESQWIANFVRIRKSERVNRTCQLVPIRACIHIKLHS